MGLVQGPKDKAMDRHGDPGLQGKDTGAQVILSLL